MSEPDDGSGAMRPDSEVPSSEPSTATPPEPNEVIWPNPESFTHSDPWLAENHDH